MAKETIWANVTWQLADLMEQYEVSEEKAEAIAEVIGSHLEDRLIELGFDVMDSLIQTFNLLDDEEEEE